MKAFPRFSSLCFCGLISLCLAVTSANAQVLPEVNEKAAREYQKKLDEERKQKQDQEKEKEPEQNQEVGQESDPETGQPAPPADETESENTDEEKCGQLIEKCRRLLQEEQQKTQPPPPVYLVERADPHKTYLKASLINNSGSLVRGEAGPEFRYSFNSLGIDIETHFDNRHFFVFYGWSFGYRKEDVRNAQSGHFFNFKTFTRFDLAPFFLKLGPGLEWGMPGNEFDQTKFVYNKNRDLISYTHVFLERNSWIPNSQEFYKAGILYPSLNLSGGFRNERFILEAGMNWNIYRFGFMDFNLPTNGFEMEKRIKLVPGFVISAGFSPY